MAEEWREIPGYEGFYEVSNLGNVRSLTRTMPWLGSTRTIIGRVLKPNINRDGYATVLLKKNKAKRHTQVGHLVALAFLPNPCNYTEVNHKDEDKTNNNVENLEWCSRVYNVNYGDAPKKKSEYNKRKYADPKERELQRQRLILARAPYIQVIEKASGKVIGVYHGLAAASEATNVSQGTIRAMYSGERLGRRTPYEFRRLLDLM